MRLKGRGGPTLRRYRSFHLHPLLVTSATNRSLTASPCPLGGQLAGSDFGKNVCVFAGNKSWWIRLA